MTELVLNGAVRQTASGLVAYYPTSIPGAVEVPRAADASVVEKLLSGARERGMTVWLGTYLPDASWHSPNSGDVVTMVAANAAVTADVMRDLDRVYAEYSDVIAGWYLGSEVNAAYGWSWTAGTALVSYYQSLTGVAAAASAAQRTMISPYYNTAALPSDGALWTSMWTRILRDAPISVFALQDGTGDCSDNVCGPWKTAATMNGELQLKFSATRAAIVATGSDTELWANMDFYDSFGVMAPIGDVAATYAVLAPFVSHYTSWSFSRQYALWTIGTGSYSTPFSVWNQGGALSTIAPSVPSVPSNVVASGAGAAITVTWGASTPAVGNVIAHYRITSPTGVRLSERMSTNWTGSVACVSVQAVDTAGNVSVLVPTC